MAKAAAAKLTIWQRFAENNEAARKSVEMWQARCHDEPSAENTAALHAAITVLLTSPKFPPGIDVITEGSCPIGGKSPIACFVCSFGHMTECHHPQDCATAQCSHFDRDR